MAASTRITIGWGESRTIGGVICILVGFFGSSHVKMVMLMRFPVDRAFFQPRQQVADVAGVI